MRRSSAHAHCGRRQAALGASRLAVGAAVCKHTVFQVWRKKCDIWWCTPLATTRTRWLGTPRGGSFSLMWSSSLSALTMTRRASNRKRLCWRHRYHRLLNLLGYILRFDSLIDLWVSVLMRSSGDSLSFAACSFLNHNVFGISSNSRACYMEIIVEAIGYRRPFSHNCFSFGGSSLSKQEWHFRISSAWCFVLVPQKEP